MMNPWIIVGFLIALGVAAFGGYQQGKKVERSAWMEKENKEIVAANAMIERLNKEARERETAHAAAVNLISTTLQGETDVAKRETERLRAAARAGSIRLRDNARAESACPSGAGEVAAPAGKRDGEAGAELSAAASDFLLALTGEADEVVRQLSACQAVVIEDRATH